MTPEQQITQIRTLVNRDPNTYKELLRFFLKIETILEDQKTRS